MLKKYRLQRPRRPIDLPFRARPFAIAWVESEDWDADGILRIEGPPDLVERIERDIRNSYGSRGRSLTEGLTPRDLAVALDGRFLKCYEAEEVEPPKLGEFVSVKGRMGVVVQLRPNSSIEPEQCLAVWYGEHDEDGIPTVWNVFIEDCQPVFSSPLHRC